MWSRYVSLLSLRLTYSSKLILQFSSQFRTKVNRNIPVEKSKPLIKNIDRSKLFKDEQRFDSTSRNLLLRPTLFTVGFTGCSFIGCAIWQYESQRNRLNKFKERWKFRENSEENRNQFKVLWETLPESKKFILKLVIINLLVFLAWKIKPLEMYMLKYFTSSPYKSNLISMVLSTFSHQNGFHILCNMYVLWSFSDPIIGKLGKHQFCAVYLSGGIISSWLSYVYKIWTRTPNVSLGASGSLMTIIGLICTQYPDAKLSIVFLPFLSFSAQSGLLGMIMFDFCGTLLRWTIFDHAAHLGGAMFGIFYVKYGYHLLWESLTPLIQHWHEIREKFK